MTIAISLKVNDGVVLAADSAATLATSEGVLNVYNNANKIQNLVKGLPIGMVTWGLGNIGPSSTSALAKDLRHLLSGQAGDSDWALDPADYTVEDVARRVRKYFWEDHYQGTFRGEEQKPGIGFIVAGYSAGASMPEEFRVQVDEGSGDCPEPEALRRPSETGLTWSGQPEAITRIILGMGTELPSVLLKRFGVQQDELDAALQILRQELTIPVVQPAMPMQDAIDLSDFLASAAVSLARFMPGAPVVGGPIEVAAITKHEGFKWIRRKYYYNRDLNPEEPK